MRIILIFLLVAAFVPLTALSEESLAEYQKKVEEQEWETLYVTKPRTPTIVELDSEYGREIMKAFETIFQKRTPKGAKLVGRITAYKNWALFGGYTASANGDQITPEDGIASDTTILFLKTREGWTVVDYGLGHSDMFFIIWPAQYGAPVELLEPPKKDKEGVG